MKWLSNVLASVAVLAVAAIVSTALHYLTFWNPKNKKVDKNAKSFTLHHPQGFIWIAVIGFLVTVVFVFCLMMVQDGFVVGSLYYFVPFTLLYLVLAMATIFEKAEVTPEHIDMRYMFKGRRKVLWRDISHTETVFKLGATQLLIWRHGDRKPYMNIYTYMVNTDKLRTRLRNRGIEIYKS